jgi:N-acetylmuramoyl-L-alanine amidase
VVARRMIADANGGAVRPALMILFTVMLWLSGPVWSPVEAKPRRATPSQSGARSHTAAKLAPQKPRTATPVRFSSRTATRPATPRRQTSTQAQTIGKPLIVVDAGHGGQDPGAVGRAGTPEKSITLATARELRRQLLATGRYQVKMTRDGDIFVPLSRRLASARTPGTMLFISIHADASPDPQARGASVYVRSGALGGRATRILPGEGSAGVLADTLSGGAKHGSGLLQYTLISTLDDDIRMTAAPARQAKLHVLANPSVPSVLLEMGYVSNRQDEALLRGTRHRATIAAGILEAIDEYMENLRHPNAVRG